MIEEFFKYKIDFWEVALCGFLEEKSILNKQNMQALIQSLEQISDAFTVSEKTVLKSIKEKLKSDSFNSLEGSYFDSCINDCEKNRGLYFSIIQLTVMLLCIYFYKEKKTGVVNEREKQIYDLSKKQILQHMCILSSYEKLTEFYARPENKVKLLSPIIFSQMETWEVEVVDETVFGTKYYFKDIDGKKHWKNSEEERKKEMSDYSISYVNKLKEADYFKDSSLNMALSRINSDCQKLVDNLSI